MSTDPATGKTEHEPGRETLFESSSFSILGSGEQALLVGAPTQELLVIGTHPGGVEGAAIDPGERWAVTGGCGAIIYRLGPPWLEHPTGASAEQHWSWGTEDDDQVLIDVVRHLYGSVFECMGRQGGDWVTIDANSATVTRRYAPGSAHADSNGGVDEIALRGLSIRQVARLATDAHAAGDDQHWAQEVVHDGELDYFWPISTDLWTALIVEAADQALDLPAERAESVWFMLGDGAIAELLDRANTSPATFHALRATHPGLNQVFRVMQQEARCFGTIDHSYWSDDWPAGHPS